jgi:Histone deacetylase domain
VPLCDGLTDDMFLETAFIPVMEEVMARFQPQVVVLQSGADSVASDKIGKFNLSTAGHASAGRWLRQAHPGIPVMALGGGGYTISNVARTWSYETIAMLGYTDDDIPPLCPLVRCAVVMELESVLLPAAMVPGALSSSAQAARGHATARVCAWRASCTAAAQLMPLAPCARRHRRTSATARSIPQRSLHEQSTNTCLQHAGRVPLGAREAGAVLPARRRAVARAISERDGQQEHADAAVKNSSQHQDEPEGVCDADVGAV